MTAAVFPSSISTESAGTASRTPRALPGNDGNDGGFRGELARATREDTRAVQSDRSNPQRPATHAAAPEPDNAAAARPAARKRAKDEPKKESTRGDSKPDTAPANATGLVQIPDVQIPAQIPDVQLPDTSATGDPGSISADPAAAPTQALPAADALVIGGSQNAQAAGTEKAQATPNLAFTARLSPKEDIPQAPVSPSDQSGADAAGPQPAELQASPEVPAGEGDAPEIRNSNEPDRAAVTASPKNTYEQAASRQTAADADQQAAPAGGEGSQAAPAAAAASAGSGRAATTRDLPPEMPSREPASGQSQNAGAAFQSVSQTKPVISDARTESAAPIDPKAALREPQSQQPAPVRDLSLRLSGAEREKIDIRLVERGGEIHVSVRTSDAELAKGLRTDLSELAGRLDHSGYRTQIWRPAESGFSQADGEARSGYRDGATGSRNGDSRQSGSSHGQNPEQEEQQQPRWLDEIAGLGSETNFQR